MEQSDGWDAFSFCYFFFGRSKEKVDPKRKSHCNATLSQHLQVFQQTLGNSHYTGDSYNWNLSNLIFDMRERHEAGIFDAVYLDGAHTFLYMGLGICLLKELLKDNGILVLDDVRWTVANSDTTRRRAIKDGMPREQMEDMQVWRAQKIFLDTDPNFELLSAADSPRSIFRKRPR